MLRGGVVRPGEQDPGGLAGRDVRSSGVGAALAEVADEEVGAAGVAEALPDAQGAGDLTALLRTCFTTVFSALVIRAAYGPGFVADPVDDATHTSQLARMSSSYLLTGRQSPPT